MLILETTHLEAESTAVKKASVYKLQKFPKNSNILKTKSNLESLAPNMDVFIKLQAHMLQNSATWSGEDATTWKVHKFTRGS